MIRKLGLISGVAAALILGVASPASAGTLDQEQSAGNSSLAIDSTQSLAQSFTAGLSGSLDQVDLSLTAFGTPSAATNVQIRNFSAGLPGDSVLASTSVPASGVSGTGGFVSFHFATPAPVSTGTQYALVAYSASVFPDDDAWSLGSGTNPYSRGNVFMTSNSPPSAPWSSNTTNDLAFRTYVAPAPPAPKKKKCKKHKHRAAASKKHCKKKK
jgi:hypothetical protein